MRGSTYGNASSHLPLPPTIADRMLGVGPDEERFTSSSLLILCNRVFSLLVGIAVLWIKTRGRSDGIIGEVEGGFRKRIRPASPILA
jgi:hypothetical protein